MSGIFAYSMGGGTSLAATLIAGLGINAANGISTAIFMMVLADSVMTKLNRLNKKYGL